MGRMDKKRRALALIIDAFGAPGGMAKFNRDFLCVLASHPLYCEVVAVPRSQPDDLSSSLPVKLRWDSGGLGGKLRYMLHIFRIVALDRRFDLVLCGHVNLLPVAWAARTLIGAPLALVIHGIEAWKPHRSTFVNRLARKADYVFAVSETTKRRFVQWSSYPAERVFVLPNCIDTEQFRPRAKNIDLIKRYGLEGRKVLMTLGRLSSTERYKGIDEILEVMPQLIQQVPNLVYLVVGEGDDRDRLANKARSLALEGSVIFAGRIAEEEKVDHYNLADAFAMPGQGEGFGIVYLEAMACGLPVVGSQLDGSKDALQDGALGILVDPRDSEDLSRGIREALKRPRGIPPALERSSYGQFETGLHAYLERITVHSFRHDISHEDG